jgi:hypothetical protein
LFVEEKEKIYSNSYVGLLFMRPEKVVFGDGHPKGLLGKGKLETYLLHPQVCGHDLIF